MITANEYYRRKFGCKVYKLSLDGGFTCPNRDGTLGTRGCLFCSEAGGGDFAEHGTAAQQLEQKRQPFVPRVPSRLGQVKPPSRDSLYTLQPNFLR